MSWLPRRIAIVGAGPIGLEAALFGVQAGFDVEVFERGTVAENVSDWGHVRLFSPFELNASPWGRAALIDSGAGGTIPTDKALLTGREFTDVYLRPLSQLSELQGRIHENTEVRSIGRCGTWKTELIGDPLRADDCFQLLVRESGTSKFGERKVLADFVFDCSGTYPNHNWCGAGGIPCVGESHVLTEGDYQLPDILGAARPRFLGQQTAVIGSGFSAATAVVSLARLAGTDAATRIIWLTRQERTPPMRTINNDALPERARLIEAANRLALNLDSPVHWRPGRLIHWIEHNPSGYLVGTSQADKHTAEATEQLGVDQLIVNVGYRPERRLYEELQIHECYATGGPISLAAALQGESSSDCLSTPAQGPNTLCNPEPGFFILGSKSYGRDSRFLIRLGIEQIKNVFQLVANPTISMT